MTVRKDVLIIYNYYIKKFDYRSGIAGFVALKLCPDLICLSLNFKKYTRKVQKVREILIKYNP